MTVVYDSSREGSKAKGVAGVAVRFAPPGTTADDVIVGLAGIPGTVVISNDREVRERAERRRPALWAEALVAWAKGGRGGGVVSGSAVIDGRSPQSSVISQTWGQVRICHTRRLPSPCRTWRRNT